MRIAHTESSLDWGGQELRIVEQTEWLNKNDHPAWIIARPGSAILREARQRGLPHHELNIRGSVNPRTLIELKSFITHNRIDVLDCHGNRDSTYGAILKWITGTAVVRSRHVTDPVRSSPMRRLLWRYGNHRIIVTAGKIRDLLVASRLSDRHRIYVAAAGVDESRFHPNLDTQGLRRQLGIEQNETVIANIGMIRPDKGQIHFVRACRQLLQHSPRITCIQLGEATSQTERYKQEVLAACGEELASGRIRFLGYKPDIENWLALTNIVVIASIATEAQTRLVAQAFLMSKNIVATTTGGLPEMIEHQKTGLLCEPANPSALAEQVQRLINDPDLAAKLRETAREHALQFMSMDFMMQGMLEAYRAAAKQAGRGRD